MDDEDHPGVYALDDDARLTLGAALKHYMASLPPSSKSFSKVNKVAATLLSRGLDFGAIVHLFGRSEEDSYVKAAREYLVREGEVEVDDPAVVSEGDDPGAYVMAWVWVPNELLDVEVTATVVGYKARRGNRQVTLQADNQKDAEAEAAAIDWDLVDGEGTP